MILKKSDPSSIEKTADTLRNGGIVIIPTDTVYGFSGIVDLVNSDTAASDTSATTATAHATFQTDAKIRAIKGRAETKPLIQLIAKPEDIRLYTDDDIPPELLAKWPGALTIIVHIKDNSPLAATAIPESRTVAFRCPGDEWLRKIIASCQAPIFSTSVNRSGQPVLDTTNAITQEFANEVDLIIDDGDKKGALPSTLVSIENGNVKVLRQGSVQI
ncbi:L-threonylcarbamoyladenylate synthase [Treponema bryantii]|uniref:L-threonylcarbamoyladenylate synthase n=1 Tax=Treponema bryantii TaxID=163 RepID=UPI0003B2E22A|nr:L-threonylcarbamoyladenylate synthase [Treponema bryantii]